MTSSRAAEITYGTIPSHEKKIEELRKMLAKVQEKTSYLREEVTDQGYRVHRLQVDRHSGDQD